MPVGWQCWRAMTLMTGPDRIEIGATEAPAPEGAAVTDDLSGPGSAPAFSERPSMIMQGLHGLDQLVAAQTTWLKSWHMDVLAGVSGSERNPTVPPQPDLSQWLRVFRHPSLAGHPSSRIAVERLRDMQAQADAIGDLVAQSGSIPQPEYGRFMNTVVEFTAALRDLQNDTWKRLANVDPLTGLGNRQAMTRRLHIERERHVRNGQVCCLAMIDLDGFKPVNDGYGHAAGDCVLAEVASLLAGSLRPYDSVFRYGGDEFLICLPNTDPRGAWAIIERLRLKAASHRISLRPGVDVRTTLSVGIAPLSEEGDIDQSLDRADQALYAAKRNGRNCVFVWRQDG